MYPYRNFILFYFGLMMGWNEGLVWMNGWMDRRNDSDDDDDGDNDDDDDNNNNVSRTALGFSGRLSYLVWFLLCLLIVSIIPYSTCRGLG